MSGQANVRSTVAIEEFRAALARFEEAIQQSLDGLDAQIRRIDDWIQHDRPSHWKCETHQAEDALHQARLDLERCLMLPVADERPSCREERAIVKKAVERVDYCRLKADLVRTWKRQLHHEIFEYRGRTGSLRQLLELELPQARRNLDKVLRRLDEYQLERLPASKATPRTEDP